MAVARWWVMAGLVVPMEVRFAIGALVVLDDVPRGGGVEVVPGVRDQPGHVLPVSGVVGVGGVGGVVAEVGAAAPHRVRLVVDADTGRHWAMWNIPARRAHADPRTPPGVRRGVPLTSPSLLLHLQSPLMTRPDVA